MKRQGHTTLTTSEARHYYYLTDEQVEALAQQHGVTVEQIRLAEQIAHVVKAPTTAPSTTGCRTLDVLLDDLDPQGLAAALACQRLAFIDNRLGDAVRHALEARLQPFIDGEGHVPDEEVVRVNGWLAFIDGLVVADGN